MKDDKKLFRPHHKSILKKEKGRNPEGTRSDSNKSFQDVDFGHSTYLKAYLWVREKTFPVVVVINSTVRENNSGNVFVCMYR